MTTTAYSTEAAAASLILDYVPADQLAALPPSWWQGVLGVAGFDGTRALNHLPVPVTASMTPQLDAPALCEVWRIAGPRPRLSSTSRLGRVNYRYCEDLLFGAASIQERDLHVHRTEDSSAALLLATEIAYREIFAVLSSSEHRHLIRIWNYLPQINASSGGDERYRHFNSARQTAFRNSGRATMGTVPAASALGSPEGSPVTVYFLAGRRPPRMVENPRQTSAYHYPPKFGRHSPIFSRACAWGGAESAALFISGTASIVGHETIHPGNVVAQTRETLVNIGALLDEANRVLDNTSYSLGNLKFKVYVRRPADLPLIKATLSEVLGRGASIVYLRADVCREDLLVEIEAAGAAGP